jgi:hypothetical protein
MCRNKIGIVLIFDKLNLLLIIYLLKFNLLLPQSTITDNDVNKAANIFVYNHEKLKKKN